MKNLPLLILLVLPFTISGQSNNHNQNQNDPQGSVKNTISAFEKSLKAKDFRIIESFLDEKFAFKNMGGPTGIMIIQQVVNGYPLQLQEIKTNKTTKEADTYIVSVTLVTTKESEDHDIILSSDYQIIKADIVNIQMGHGSNPNAEKKPEIQKILPEREELSISFTGDNHITTPVQMNGKMYDFIIDTAAPKISINNDVIALGREGSDSYVAKGATGAAAFFLVSVNELKVKGITWKNFSAHSSSLGHFTKAGGLIGANFFNDYLTIVDYRNKKITLHKLTSGSVNDMSVLKNFKLIESRKINHLSIIEATIGVHKFNFIVDTGATTFMIDSKNEDKVKDYIKYYNEKTRLKGAGKEVVEVKKGVLSSITVAGHVFENLEIIISEAPRPSHGDIQIDGIIGYGLLSQGVFAYNPATGKMYLGQ